MARSSRQTRPLLLAIGFLLLTFFYLFWKNNSEDSYTENQSPTPERLHTWQIPYDNYNEECVNELAKSECSSEIHDRTESGQLRPMQFSEKDFTDLRKILLIIQFNDPHYVAASKNYAIYYRLFGDVVFCGPDNATEFWPTWDSTRRDHKIVSLPASSKFYTMGAPITLQSENCYLCVDLVVGDKTIWDGRHEGIMLVGDDVIPHYWTWRDAEKKLDKNWIMEYMSSRRVYNVDNGKFCYEESANNEGDCVRESDWPWTWRFYNNSLNFYNEFEQLANIDNNYWREIYNNMTRVAGGRRRLWRGGAAMFYIARHYLPKVRPMFRLMNKHRVFCEAGVSAAIMAVSRSDDVQYMDTKGYDFGDGFIRYHTLMHVYKTEYQFLHPFKLGAVFYNQTSSFAVNESTLFPSETRGSFNKETDLTVDCVYCYLRNLSIAYEETFYKNHTIKL